MSLLKKLEDEAHLLLQELKERVGQQISVGNKIDPKLHELIQHLEAHVNPTPAPVVDATPVVSEPVATVVEPTITVEAPQTVAQEQSASNVAN
jgi:hypothetical protein